MPLELEFFLINLALITWVLHFQFNCLFLINNGLRYYLKSTLLLFGIVIDSSHRCHLQ